MRDAGEIAAGIVNASTYDADGPNWDCLCCTREELAGRIAAVIRARDAEVLKEAERRIAQRWRNLLPEDLHEEAVTWLEECESIIAALRREIGGDDG